MQKCWINSKDKVLLLIELINFFPLSCSLYLIDYALEPII